MTRRKEARQQRRRPSKTGKAKKPKSKRNKEQHSKSSKRSQKTKRKFLKKNKSSDKKKSVDQNKTKRRLDDGQPLVESARQSPDFEACYTKLQKFARADRKASTLDKQFNRITKFKKLTDSKKGKKGDFQGTYDTLLSALGGNASEPQCDGNPITRTAKGDRVI